MALTERNIMQALASEDAVERLTGFEEFQDNLDIFDPQEKTAVVLRALEDDNYLIREAGIRCAAICFEETRLLDLVANQENASLRNGGIEALVRKGPSVNPAIIEALNHPDEDVVLFSTQILTRLKVPASAEAFLGLLEHENKNIAQAAIEGLGALGERRAVPQLLQIMNTDMWLQFAALEALGNIGDPHAAAAILHCLEDETQAVLALDALKNISASEVLPALFSYMLRDDRLPHRDKVAQVIAETMRRSGSRYPELAKELSQRLHKYPEPESFLSYLRRSLASEDEDIRLAAIELVAALAISEMVFEALTSVLKVEDTSKARTAFLHWGSSIQKELETGLEADDDKMAVFCAELLGLLGNSKSRLPLLDALNRPSKSVQVAALKALLSMPAQTKTVDRVIETLGSPHPEVRDEAVQCLLNWKTGVRSKLVKAWSERESHPEFLIALLKYFEQSPPKNGEESMMLEALERPEEEIRIQALHTWYACELEGKHLLSALDDSSEKVRIAAINLVGGRKTDKCLDRLLSMLDCREDQLFFVVRALGRLRSARSIDPVIKIYASSTLRIQLEILEVMGRIRGDVAAAFLRRHVSDVNLEIRRTAAAALARFKQKEDMDCFMELLESTDWYLRKTAAWALGEIGDSKAVESLKALKADRESLVSRTASEAIEKLGSHR